MVSSGPQPGTYTLSWTAPAGVTIQEYRVQSIQASGTPVPLARAAGSQSSVAIRVDPAMGYAVAVYAVDTSNRVSGPSNVVNTAGAPTATPIPPGSAAAGQAPYGYGGAPVPGATGTQLYGGAPGPGTTGTQPYGGAYSAQPYSGANSAQPYSGANPAQPYNGTYSAQPYGSAYPQAPYGSAYPQAPYGGAYPQTPYGSAYGPQRPPLYGPTGGFCPGIVLIGGQCLPR